MTCEFYCEITFLKNYTVFVYSYQTSLETSVYKFNKTLTNI